MKKRVHLRKIGFQQSQFINLLKLKGEISIVETRNFHRKLKLLANHILLILQT